MTRTATKVMAVLITLGMGFGVGCGGSSTASGVDGSKQVSSLDSNDKKNVCDWFAGLVGGYGTATTCSMAQLMAPASQTDCLTGFPVCAVTVATFESCVQKIIAAQKTCTAQSMSDAETSAECTAIGQAACFQ